MQKQNSTFLIEGVVWEQISIEANVWRNILEPCEQILNTGHTKVDSDCNFTFDKQIKNS